MTDDVETWGFETPKRGKSHIAGHVYVDVECDECGNRKVSNRSSTGIRHKRYDCHVCDNSWYA